MCRDAMRPMIGAVGVRLAERKCVDAIAPVIRREFWVARNTIKQPRVSCFVQCGAQGSAGCAGRARESQGEGKDAAEVDVLQQTTAVPLTETISIPLFWPSTS